MDGNGEAPDIDQETNLDNQVQDPCLNKAVDNVINGGESNPFSEVINGTNYQGDGGSNLNFIQSSDNSASGIKTDGSMGGSPFNQNINLNLAALDYASDEHIAATIYHEIIHAHLRNEGISGGEHHNIIATDWRDIISNQLQADFPDLSETEADALAWGGLSESDAWQTMVEEDNANNTGITGAIAAINVNHKNVNNINNGSHGTREECD